MSFALAISLIPSSYSMTSPATVSTFVGTSKQPFKRSRPRFHSRLALDVVVSAGMARAASWVHCVPASGSVTCTSARMIAVDHADQSTSSSSAPTSLQCVTSLTAVPCNKRPPIQSSRRRRDRDTMDERLYMPDDTLHAELSSLPLDEDELAALLTDSLLDDVDLPLHHRAHEDVLPVKVTPLPASPLPATPATNATMSADSSSPGTPVSPANSDEISEDGDPGSTPPPVHRTRKGVHSEEEESSTSSSAAPRKTNAYRKRQRQELEYLRDKVKELETQLSELETARNADTRMDANLSTVWEGIAIKQKQETRRVEQENAELREAIEDQIKLATLLQKMLTKRPRLAILDRLAPSRFEACMSAEEAAAARRQELFAKLPERYMELNTVFEETRLDKMAKDTRSKGFGITKSPEGRESLYIQLLESKVVPFNVAKVLAACKRFFADPNKALNHGTYHCIEMTDLQTYSEFHMTFPLRGETKQFSGNLAIELFPGFRRNVCVMESFSAFDTPIKPNGPILRWRESMYVVIEPLKSFPLAATIIKLCMRIRPCLSDHNDVGKAVKEFAVAPRGDDEESVPEKPGTLIEFAIGSHQRDVSMFFQHVENMLMEQAVNSKSKR